jgi:prepilin-type N-terminal cleavage/methylation domain-containing protein
MMNRRKGFTLIEILIAVMLTGLLTTLALAPVVITVRRVVETQQEYSDLSALSRTMSFIERDLSSAMRLSSNVLTIVDHESLGGKDDDVLMIMSTSPTVQNMPAGTVVYKVSEGGIMHSNVIPGLYRWIFPGKMPNVIKTDTLNPEEAQLVLPDVNEFCVEVPTGLHEDDRRKEYRGSLPAGVYIKIARHKNDSQNAYSNNNNEERLDELERIIVFP